jgi:hypothetical protein
VSEGRINGGCVVSEPGAYDEGGDPEKNPYIHSTTTHEMHKRTIFQFFFLVCPDAISFSNKSLR